MATAADNLTTTFNNACAALAALDAAIANGTHRMTYTEGDKTYSWNEYRAALWEQVKGFPDALKGLQAASGPWTETSVVRG